MSETFHYFRTGSREVTSGKEGGMKNEISRIKGQENILEKKYLMQLDQVKDINKKIVKDHNFR